MKNKDKKVVHEVTSNNIGFWGLLTIVFITLKLCGVIDWSWVWVLMPLIASCAVVFVCLFIAGVCWALAAYLRDQP